MKTETIANFILLWMSLRISMGRYVVFGKVITNIELVEKIGRLGGFDGKPKTPIRIESCHGIAVREPISDEL